MIILCLKWLIVNRVKFTFKLEPSLNWVKTIPLLDVDHTIVSFFVFKWLRIELISAIHSYLNTFILTAFEPVLQFSNWVVSFSLRKIEFSFQSWEVKKNHQKRKQITSILMKCLPFTSCKVNGKLHAIFFYLILHLYSDNRYSHTAENAIYIFGSMKT